MSVIMGKTQTSVSITNNLLLHTFMDKYKEMSDKCHQCVMSNTLAPCVQTKIWVHAL